MVQKWLVAVDGSDLAEKAIHAASAFMTNEDDEDDELTLVHTYCPNAQSGLPPHLRREHLRHHYDLELAKCRTEYEVTGPSPLRTHFLEAQQLHAGKTHTRDTLLEVMETQVHPDMLFIGSFGEGGDVIDELGSLTDGLVQLAKANVAIIKNMQSIPKASQGTRFLFALDGDAPTLESLTYLIRLIKPNDTVDVCYCCYHEGAESRRIISRAQEACNGCRDDGRVTVNFEAFECASCGKEGIAKALLRRAKMDGAQPDFIVTVSRQLTGNKRFSAKGTTTSHLSRMQVMSSQSVSLYIAEHARCHSIVLKPCYDAHRLTSKAASHVAASRDAAAAEAAKQ